MPKVTGPTIPRWQLGAELARLREAAGVSIARAAAAIGRSESQIRKFELGHSTPAKTELPVLLELYATDETDLHDSLEELRQAGTTRGWWSRYGTLPWTYATYLGLEEGAIEIKSFEPSTVPSLLQTERYARALIETLHPDADEMYVDRQVGIRMTRQRRVLDDDPPKLRTIVDEAVLRRPVGDTAGMREQLDRLTAAAEQDQLRVLPLASGPHPGQAGGFTILEFPDRVHSPIVYVESQAGSVFMEKPADLDRCGAAYDRLAAMALDRAGTLDLLAAADNQNKTTG